jgi:hypothetical protein
LSNLKIKCVFATFIAIFLAQWTRPSAASAQPEHAAHWRTATEKELAAFVPDRVPVIAERIETESRTASGITDGSGHIIAAAVLITAGYSSNGKYSDILLTQVPIKIGDKTFPAGHYLLGWTRGEDDLAVTFSEASSGRPVVTVTAAKSTTIRGVQSIRIWPPSEHSVIQLGRFAIPYSIP